MRNLKQYFEDRAQKCLDEEDLLMYEVIYNLQKCYAEVRSVLEKYGTYLEVLYWDQSACIVDKRQTKKIVGIDPMDGSFYCRERREE